MNSEDVGYFAMLAAGGLLGSAHCLGMCGGFVLALGANAGTANERLARQLVYAAGRVWVYVLAGAAAGFTGWRLGLEAGSLVVGQAVLTILAGSLLAFEALASLGWIRRPSIGSGSCSLASVGSLLRSGRLTAVFAAGVWNALLPCGLLYGYLALAAGSGSVLIGAVVMLLFGIGTVPALTLLGMSGSLVPARFRQRILRVAAVALLISGSWTIYRGFAHFQATADRPACPLCRGGDSISLND